ncbi:MAG: tripartite tricarboxylate transporter substrate binding protein [Tropicimonas sp.]|uniref:tripartite tricarboxylate transporter substrate binding protein n=1 Tax=Tropicimonas sp. TaxID=2067044 RepID=UPI003A89B8BE
MKILKTFLAATAATTAIVAGALSASAADYPDRPITLIVPWGAGGGTDATGRILATMMEEKLGQPVNVVNRTGGGSVIGHKEIADAAPDGYTLGIITTELSMFHWAGMSDLTYQDYTTIGLYNADPSSVVVKTGTAVEDMDSLVAAIREDASAIRAGGANQGGLNHLAYVSLVNELGGNRAFWVPTEGAAPALQLLASGAINVGVVQLPEAQGLIDAGELKAVAILGAERNPDHPDLPTIKEATGVDFPISGWRGLGGPKGLPEDIRATLVSAMEEIVASDEFVELMATRAYGVVWEGGDAFTDYLARRDEAFGAAMTSAGLVKQ